MPLLWAVAVALVGHGVFDFVHGMIISHPGVPGWWPQFCGSIDVALGAWVALQLKRGRISERSWNRGGLPGVTSA
jgi:hypothetical protein